ncbi:MAG: aminoacyl-tRNA hydrolase [Candidatus Magasanikbacteria bacterium]|nr:aminoacyl-tRNA hydrolase [Candidatus Magasanikbacteria bacterium]
MKLIIGLGNPGKKYEKTRHNVGFMVLDKLHNKLLNKGVSEWQLSKKFNAMISGLTVSGEKIILAKPMTFMNASGQAVQLIAHYYKISPEDIIIIHDDKDIELGEIKIQNERGDAGHNGIRSIQKNIKSNEFTRIRVGIGSSDKKMKDVSKFVLSKFSIFERKKVDDTINKAVNILLKKL